MSKICYRPCLLTAMALLCFTTAQGGTTAQTDLASITVTPLSHQAGAKADWQTIYDYSGGVLPPGTQIISEGKWIDPIVRREQSGVTFAFPDLPDSPENSQYLKIGIAFDRPIADYPTRATIQYTSFFDQTMPDGEWSPFLLLPNDNPKASLFGTVHLPTGNAKNGKKHGDTKPQPSTDTAVPFKPVGDNTLGFSLDDKGVATSITMNDQDVTSFFLRKAKDSEKTQPGAMLMNKLVFYNNATQFPHNKGDWFAVHSFKIEQMRPPLEDSSEAAIDLSVPGSEPVTVTIEVVDAQNDSRGYVLRDALVSPGKYRLYWDGIDQKTIKPDGTVWIGSGSYTFRLTTSKTALHYAGEVNNSAPKYTTKSYQMINCTALAVSPPGTAAQTDQPNKWKSENNANDTRKFDATDSVHLLEIGYDGFCRSQWLGSDGVVINTSITNTQMQHGRDIAITPPDPSDPTDPGKQFYFVSQNAHGGNAIISGSISNGKGEAPPKTLTSPDWNRTSAGFVSYKVQLGQIPGGGTLGPQHELFFKMGTLPYGEKPQAEWVIRNVRFYEEGSPDPGPMTFDPAKLSTRKLASNKRANTSSAAPLTTVSETTPPVPPKTPPPSKSLPIAPGTVMVEDNGHAVHLKNASSVNYPMEYTVTPNTIMAFDLDVIDASKPGDDNGIGLSPDVSGQNKDDAPHYFHFLGGKSAHDPRSGFNEPALGAYSYPVYQPNTLYTDSVPLPPVAASHESGGVRFNEINFLWQPGFYGLKISEDGKFLFACNNADNRLEIRDISTDGHAVAKIPINYPMFVTLAPEGAAGARQGTRYVYVDSPKEGLLRIAWNLSDNTFGKPETFVPTSEFAYPRGLVYSTVDNRIFVCDTFNLDRSKQANQIVVIDPTSGKILSRFGKQGGVDPQTSGQIDDGVFTCPLTIDADSKGNLWVNDYYTCEVRKYNFDPATNGFKLERNVLGSNMGPCSQFYWLPDGPPTRVWTVQDFFVRDDADIDSNGRYTNQRATSAARDLTEETLRPYTHFCKVGDHVYATFASQNMIYEQKDDGWIPRFAFGGTSKSKDAEDVETVARRAGLLAKPGEPPTALDKAIAASGDADWKTRPWVWSDLNGDGEMEYSADNPEFKIDFGSDFSLHQRFPSTCFRASDGAFVCPDTDNKAGESKLIVILPQMVNGRAFYDWGNAKTIPCVAGEPIVDVLAQDDRYYVLRNHGRPGFDMGTSLECYDESGKLLWTREHNNTSLQSLQTMGDGMVSVMDRGWSVEGPVMIRTKDGDLVSEVFCRDNSDSWSNGALRADADTGYIGLVQVNKVTGLSTVKTATATVNLPPAGR